MTLLYRKPSLSTRTGTSRLNIDSATGIVVPSTSEKALRQAMDRLHHRPDRAEHMRLRIRKRYERTFTGQLMETRYYPVHRSLAADATDALCARYA